MDSDNKFQEITEKDLDFSSEAIGSGAFGQVFLAKVKRTGEKVAVKKVFQDKRYKNRELAIMKELNHPNIVNLRSFYYTKAPEHGEDEYFLNCVMDYVPKTLSTLISHNRHNKTKFHNILIKLYSYQMLKCIGYMRSLGICHRDIKPQNILIDSDHTLKLCDFGCAKHLVKEEPNIAYICSRYYRPPELVVGATEYSTQVDVWSMGCVIAELVLNRPIFPGKNAKEQLHEIIKVLGTPTEEQLKVLNNRSKIVLKISNYSPKPWEEVFKKKIDDPLFFDLISKLLVYEPDKRLTPYAALCHPYFDELGKKDLELPDGEKLPSHLFEFLPCEIKSDKKSIEYLMKKIKDEGEVVY